MISSVESAAHLKTIYAPENFRKLIAQNYMVLSLERDTYTQRSAYMALLVNDVKQANNHISISLQTYIDQIRSLLNHPSPIYVSLFKTVETSSTFNYKALENLDSHLKSELWDDLADPKYDEKFNNFTRLKSLALTILADKAYSDEDLQNAGLWLIEATYYAGLFDGHNFTTHQIRQSPEFKERLAAYEKLKEKNTHATNQRTEKIALAHQKTVELLVALKNDKPNKHWRSKSEIFRSIKKPLWDFIKQGNIPLTEGRLESRLDEWSRDVPAIKEFISSFEVTRQASLKKKTTENVDPRSNVFKNFKK